MALMALIPGAQAQWDQCLSGSKGVPVEHAGCTYCQSRPSLLDQAGQVYVNTGVDSTGQGCLLS